MRKEAAEQEKLVKLEKEKEKEQSKQKDTSNENTSKNSSKEKEVATSSNSTKIIKENGQEFIVDSHGGKMSVGSAGIPLKSKKTTVDPYKDIEPMYKKYEEEPDPKVMNRRNSTKD